MARLALIAAIAVAGVAHALAAPASVTGARIQLANHPGRMLERFVKPHSVQASETAPDGRFAFIWYRGSRPPLRLSIYDLRSMTKTADFAPGFGGDLHFTPHGNVVHTWGCGTNCAGYALYDWHGRTLLSGSTSGAEVSPKRHFLVTFPSLVAATEPIAVFDLDAGRRAFQSDPALDGSFVGNDVRWDEAHGTIEVRLSDSLGKSHRLVIRPDASGRLAGSFPDGLPQHQALPP